MRLIDADVLIDELKQSALHHCNNPREDSLLQRDRVIVRAQPTVEAIPKDQYEARLKADLVAMLTEIQLEIEEVPKYCMTHDGTCVYRKSEEYISDINNVIQQKINALKESEDDKI
jgi:hypothetical protein